MSGSMTSSLIAALMANRFIVKATNIYQFQRHMSSQFYLDWPAILPPTRLIASTKTLNVGVSVALDDNVISFQKYASIGRLQLFSSHREGLSL